MARFCKNDFFKWAQKIKSVFCFNPHTHEGCDTKLDRVIRFLISFNPHTHEGCDNNVMRYKLMSASFNPHTHEGCDPAAKIDVILDDVSIHTPTKGVTVFSAILYKLKWSFNPHTHEGCDEMIM